MRPALILPFALFAAISPPAASQGASTNVARSLAATCANCHGTNGVSVGGFDSLAGKPKDDLVRAMRDFKAGTRPATVMGQLAKGYSDDQIVAIAGWFATQKAPAK